MSKITLALILCLLLPTIGFSQINAIPSIKADMNVTEAGGLIYDIPIEVLKGINNFQPNLALSYSSQSGNGMAGWGWNIAGISTITRGGKSKKTDGITVGRQYDGNDPYYLDGQRLLNISTTEFQTEKFSKIKITKENSEYSFTVQYNDGKIAKYKELVEGQHYISLIKDAFDNEIHYKYVISDNTVYISKISYGGVNENTDKFWIDFTYSTRASKNRNYRNAILYINDQYLSSITVKSSYLSQNNNLYRKYIFTFDMIQGGTIERLNKVEIENENGLKLKPLLFKYNNTTPPTFSGASNSVPAPYQQTKGLGSVSVGDFNATGKSYPIYEIKQNDDTYKLWNSKTGALESYNTSRQLFAGRSLRPGNFITENELLITLDIDYTSPTVDKLNFKFYDFVNNGSKTVYLEIPGVKIGQENWQDPYLNYPPNVGNPIVRDKVNRKVISGDFNNDGLIDILIFQPGGVDIGNKCYLAEIGKVNGGSIVPIEIQFADFNKDHKFFPIEFNGDGIPEILIVSNFTSGNNFARVYKLNNLNSAISITAVSPQLTFPSTFTDRTPLLFGDFNGDGLTDFYMPKKIYSISGSTADVQIEKIETETLLWDQYISNGNTFIHSVKDFTAQRLAYIAPAQRNIIKKSSFFEKFWDGIPDVYTFTEYGSSSIISIDVNNDGKTDLVSFKKFGTIKYGENLWESVVNNLNTFSYSSETANKIYFHITRTDLEGSTTLENLPNTVSIKDNVISPLSLVFSSTDFNGLNSYKNDIIVHDPLVKMETYFRVNNDNPNEGLLTQVDNGSTILQKIEYRPMAEKNNNNNEEVYTTSEINIPNPYFVSKNNGTIYLVHKLHTVFDNSIITNEYRYHNAIQKLDGTGFMGFQKTLTSDTYESIIVNGKYSIKYPEKGLWWTIKTYDYNFENALSSVSYGSLDPNFVFNRTIINNKIINKGNSYIIINDYESSTDYLKGIVINKSYEYEETDDVLLKKVVTNYNNTAMSIERFTYATESFNGQHYFSGKISKTENTSTREGDIYMTREEQDYNNNGTIQQKRVFGNDPTKPAIITAYTYKPYNEIETESVSSQGITPIVTTFDYDVTHRFLWKKTNPDGLISEVNVDATGRLLSEISTLGLTTSYAYDGWGNVNEITNYLGKKTFINKYQGDIPGSYYITKTTEGGDESITTFDKFDRQVEKKSKGLGNQWVIARTEYDAFGRKIKESLPFFDGETIKWNVTEYDELNRPSKITSFTGKTTTTCYEGLKITVDDGYKKTKKWLDSTGNVIQHEDGGGTIYYKYFANGSLKETNYEGIKTTLEIDGWGNKKKLIDPSAGTYQYTYDNLNRIKTEVNPKGGITTYNYDATGKLISETTAGGTGENTNISKTYTYDPVTKLLTIISGTYNSRQYTYTTTYDNIYHRITSVKEETPEFTYQESNSYDPNYGRIEHIEKKTTLNEPNFESTSTITNLYDAHGILFKQLDGQQPIWEITQVNAQGKLTHIDYGNGYSEDNVYNEYNLTLERIKHFSTNSTLLDIQYNYNALKGVLNYRNNLTFNKNEGFVYDDLDRLIQETVNGAVTQQYTYDNRGRMTSNTEVGKYNYSENDYKLQSVNFNTAGSQLNAHRGFATLVTYNSFRSPNEIFLQGKDRISYDFSILKTRSVSYYGSLDTDKTQRPNRKYYSADKSVEIVKEGQVTKIITYLTGDVYSANYMKIDVLGGSNPGTTKYFLHRDNQSTPLAITKADGSVVEKRYFDAWGNLKGATNASNASLLINVMGWNNTLLIDRGYTGHEYLKTVGLVHMNARIYDPKLRRFLSPDNFVQDSENTQTYNRYGYVFNNPLLYTDLSGEEPITLATAIIIGVATAIIANGINNVIHNVPFWYGAGKAGVMGGIQGAISFGIGSMATSTFTSSINQALFQAGAHGYTGAFMSGMNGGDFGSGFAAGAVSSLVSSGIGTFGSTGGLPNKFGSSSGFKAVLIASGGLSGGISSSIAGGNFWQGAQQGVITAGLNHLAHSINSIGDKRTIKTILEDAGMDPNSSPGESDVDRIMTIHSLLEIEGFKDINKNIKDAEISYEFPDTKTFVIEGRKIVSDWGGFMDPKSNSSFEISIVGGARNTLWEFAYVLGKELYMVGRIMNQSYANDYLNKGGKWANWNLEVQSYENWVLPLSPSNMYTKSLKMYKYYLKLRGE